MKNISSIVSILVILTLSALFISFSKAESDSKIVQLLSQSSNLKKDSSEYQIAQKKLSFAQWSVKFGKSYENQYERHYREQIYLNNLLKIHLHNKQYQRGLSTWFMALNAYSDMSEKEFMHMFNWKRTQFQITLSCLGSIMDAPNPPAALDWGSKIVTGVIDQGQCGQAWAIVAASAVESLYALKVGPLQPLSVQQLLECSGDYGNEGCFGGFMDQAFWYIIDNGIATSKTYPDRQVSTCKYVPNMKFTSFSRCSRVPSQNYSKLLSAIVQQPVSVALNQSPDMQSYGGGVYDGKCTSDLNHGMLLTGYDQQDDQTYWILRNSLGTSWGIDGYIHLKRSLTDGEGKCGVQLAASVPQNIK